MGRAERAVAEQPFDELIQHWLATLVTTNTRDASAVDDLAAAEAFDARLDALVSLIVFDGLQLGDALALDIDDVLGRTPNMTIRVRRLLPDSVANQSNTDQQRTFPPHDDSTTDR